MRKIYINLLFLKHLRLFTALILGSSLHAAPHWPGLSQLPNFPDEVGSTLSYFKGIDGYDHGITAIVNGYLMRSGAALEFYDLSDACNPKLMHRQMDKQTVIIRESLSIGSMDGRYYAFLGSDGMVIWDLVDITKPIMVSHLLLSNMCGARDYIGIRWVGWQATCLYCAGTEQQLFAVDTKDVANPKIVKHFHISELAGFPLGGALAFGNVLLISSTAQSDINAPEMGGRFTSLDISDPRDPFVIRTINSVNNYAGMIMGYKILAPGVNGESSIPDFSAADSIDPINTVDAGGPCGYAAFQDGYAFIGHHHKVAKIPTTGGPPCVAWTTASPIENKDDNFAIPLGKILFAGQDRGVESALIVHAAEADSSSPEINIVAPRGGAPTIIPPTAIGITLWSQALWLHSNKSTKTTTDENV